MPRWAGLYHNCSEALLADIGDNVVARRKEIMSTFQATYDKNKEKVSGVKKRIGNEVKALGIAPERKCILILSLYGFYTFAN